MAQRTKRKTKAGKQTFARARTIVIACSRLWHKNVSADFVDLVAERIVSQLPVRLARRLETSLDGKAMMAAMELTRPYLA